VRDWLEEVSGEKSGEEDLADWLHDGQLLCKVANTLQSGICPRINTSVMPFKQMENVSAFIQACRKLGVLEKDVFSTVDLYEKKNMKAVCQCIYSLGSVVRTSAPSFNGPYLGVAQNAAVTDVARKKSVVTQDMGYRKDIDAEVRAGARKSRIAGEDPGTGASPAPALATGPSAASPAASPRQATAASRQAHLATPPAEARASSRSPSPGWARPEAAAGAAAKARLAGALLKLSPTFLVGWQLRWFEVGGERMKYWASPAEASAGQIPKGEVLLQGLKVQTQGAMKFDVTTASSGDRTFSLDADVAQALSGSGWTLGPAAPPSMQDWIKALEQEAVLARRSA